MRRLLLLITDLEIGGTPIVVRELATRLAAHAHVEVACLKPAGPIGAELRERGVLVTSLEATRLTELGRATAELLALVREREIDTVFSFLIHANFVAARAARRLPGVRFFQSIQTTQPRPRWHWWLQRRIQSAAVRIIVPSESVAQRAVERSRVPREKIVVIPNAVDADAFEGIRAGGMTARVGFVGRLDPVKNVPTLIDAIGRLPANVRLEIYGDGPMRPSIQDAIASAGLADRVTLHEAVADPRTAYGNIDLLVLPSEAEGFGLVLIEAMAAGVPVIGTDVDGIRDVIRPEQTGLLVPADDPAALAQAIRRMIDDANLRERLVAAAKIDVRARFGWPAVIGQYREALGL